MIYRILADLVVLCHLVFIFFVVFGGLLVIRGRWISFVHLPAVVWGALIEFRGGLCPLTTLEWRLREAGGSVGYGSGFMEHYLIPILYPERLTRGVQVALGVTVLIINASVYGWLLWRSRRGD